MKRREFIALLGGAAAWPLSARAQQRAMPVIGFFGWGLPERDVAAFRQGLAEAGYVEGRNLSIEYRWAEGQYSRLPILAADLVRRQVAVIVASGSTGIALAAAQATSTIPIVVAAGGNPVEYGLAASLNRPGSNVTGVTLISTELAGKRLGLLREMVPQTKTVAYLSGGARFMRFENEASSVFGAAGALGWQVIVVEARNDGDFEAAFATLIQRQAGALIVGVVPHFTYNSNKIVALAAHHKVPAIYPFPVYAFGGGLMSYGADVLGTLRQVARDYVAKILKGAKPADLPVQRPNKFELVINLKTAKALGLEVPPMLLALADKVIE
jgi:putative tryptophan/tyrosine transport system substrate-binding protein